MQATTVSTITLDEDREQTVAGSLPVTRSIKVAAYGAPGVGKTDQIALLARSVGRERVFVCSYERGLGSVASELLDENIYEIDSIDRAREVRALLPDRLASIPGAWVCHDGTSTALQYLANEDFRKLEQAFDLAYARKPLPHDLAIYARYLSNRDEPMALGMDTQALYGRIGMRSEDWWNSWAARAPWNTYANFTEEMTEHDARTRQRKGAMGPDVPGKVGLRAIVGKFDCIIRLTRERDGSTTAFTSPGPLHIAKVRADRWAGVVVPAEIRKFDLSQFIDLLNGAGAPEERA